MRALYSAFSFTFKTAAAAVLAAAVTGCTVGPAFRRPQPPAATGYTSTALPQKTRSAPVAEGTAQSFISVKNIPARWWALFNSPALDHLEDTALKQNYTLAAARAALAQASDLKRAQAGALLYPQIDATGTATRERFSGAAFGNPGMPGIIFNLFNASAKVSYMFDFFGGNRRQIEALGAQVDYQRFQLEGAYIALTANIATTAMQEASVRAQITATKEVLADQEKQLSIMERQLALGGVSNSDVLAQKSQVAQTMATLPPLEKGLYQTRHQLAAFAGLTPDKTGTLPQFDIGGFTLPAELPLSLPSSLLHQRPDIRASEALLHQASAQIGVATSAMFPQITFNAGIGTETTKIEDLFGENTSIWNFGLSLLAPIFHGGELTAKRRAAIDAYKQALAQYQETVLGAFQNVADVLRALDRDAAYLNAQAQAWAAARSLLNTAMGQFRQGAVSYLQLLNAQRQYQQAEINLVQARAARLADTAALFQALGGGWWNRNSPSATAMENK